MYSQIHCEISVECFESQQRITFIVMYIHRVWPSYSLYIYAASKITFIPDCVTI